MSEALAKCACKVYNATRLATPSSGSLIYSLGAFLLGTQLLCMGFLAELIVARGQESRAPYSIRKQIGGSPKE